MIRVIVADDHHLVRQGICALLDKAPDMEVVGEAEDGMAALELVRRTPPDILVLDLAMPRMNGIQTIERVQALGGRTRVVVLSMYSDETLVRQAIRSGAAGYLLKRSVTEELLLAIRAATRGETYLSPSVSRVLVEAVRQEGTGHKGQVLLDRLTPRERQVLQLVAEGCSNGEIGNTLGVSKKTVEKHRGNLVAKLGVKDLASLIRIALKQGVIFLEE
ncbi:MAG: response regulator transcription factor [Deferrisomatales bacterium]|nr:response regulator transcription factor [Deferrisomatales bacterium]